MCITFACINIIQIKPTPILTETCIWSLIKLLFLLIYKLLLII